MSADVPKVYNSWLEIPLRAERSVPFQCAVSSSCSPPYAVLPSVLIILVPQGYDPDSFNVPAFRDRPLLRCLFHHPAVASAGIRDCFGRNNHRESPAPSFGRLEPVQAELAELIRYYDPFVTTEFTE